MNKYYRLVFDEARRMLVPVAELQAARGKGRGRSHGGARLSAVALLVASLGSECWPGTALAGGAPAAVSQAQSLLPQSGRVLAGSARIATPSVDQMVIEQSSQRAVIDWQSFNIGAGDTVRFAQPSSTAQALNRVVGLTGTGAAGANASSTAGGAGGIGIEESLTGVDTYYGGGGGGAGSGGAGGAGGSGIAAVASNIAGTSDTALTANTTVTLTGTVTLGAGTRSTFSQNTSAAEVIVEGVLSGSGSLAQAGTGTLTLAANNAYTGATNRRPRCGRPGRRRPRGPGRARTRCRR